MPGKRKPTVAFIDDDDAFLKTARTTVRTLLDDRLTMIPIQVPGEDPVAKLSNAIRNRTLDAIFVDKNIEGSSFTAILDELGQEFPQMNDIPVVIMTAHLQEVEDPEDTLERGALGYIPKYTQTGSGEGEDAISLLLRQVVVSIPQLRGQIEDKIWIEVTRGVSKRVENGEDLPGIAEWIDDALNRRFGTCAIYLRTLDNQNLKLVGTDHLHIGKVIEAGSLPFMAKLTRQDGNHDAVRIESLGAEQIGPGKPTLLGLQALAAPIVLNGNVLGTIAFYRQPDRHPFRRKDENHLEHMALQFAAFIGREQERSRLRQRQIELAGFIQRISVMTEENDAADALVVFLHEEVNNNDNKESKTTLRMIAPGTRRLHLIKRLGIKHRDDADGHPIIEWEVDKSNSTHARAVKSRRTERYADIIADPPKEGVHQTTDDPIRSVLTVPLLADELSLGACNLESTKANRYSIEDQVFVEALARASATVIVKLRSQKFLLGLVQLLNRLINPPDIADTDAVLSQAFRLLITFSGCARLLYLAPPNPRAPIPPGRRSSFSTMKETPCHRPFSIRGKRRRTRTGNKHSYFGR